MSFKAAKTSKSLVTAFKSGNMFKQPLRSRVLAKKPRYFINKPAIGVYSAFNARIRALTRAPMLDSRSRRLFGNTNISLVTMQPAKRFYGDQAREMKQTQQTPQQYQNGITIGDKFTPIENPQTMPIKLSVGFDSSELRWDPRSGRYFIFDLDFGAFRPRMLGENNSHVSDELFDPNSSLAFVLKSNMAFNLTLLGLSSFPNVEIVIDLIGYAVLMALFSVSAFIIDKIVRWMMM